MKFVVFVMMDCFVVFGKSLFEEIILKLVDFCEMFVDEVEEFCVSFFLGVIFDNY